MPTVQEVWQDPDFHRLPPTEKAKVMQSIDSDFAALPMREQNKVVFQLSNQNVPPQQTVTGNPNASPAETERGRREWVAREGTIGTRVKEGAKTALKDAIPYVRPVLEGGGAALGSIAGGLAGAGGGLLGGPAAPATVPYGAIAGGIAGAATGYATGKYLSDMAEGVPQSAGQTLKDLGTGATYEMGGQAVAPAVGMLAKGVGAVAKPVLGRLAGTGSGAVNEALKSGMQQTNSLNPFKSTTAYDKALRGGTTGEEVVDIARTALGKIKDARSGAYQGQLQQIAQQSSPIDIRPVKNEVLDLMNKYNVKVDPATGAIDTSRIAMGKSGRNDIKDVIAEVSSWGSKQGDNTALGLDTLKRRLDDFYSDSSQARQFVAQIRNKVKDTIVYNVPQYETMTKGYTEATKIIKDVEAGLMLRKQGMSGRIVADQTLRRLMSSMKDNFTLRQDLVNVLGKEGGSDLGAAIAGYAHNSILPVGLAGTGPALMGSAALTKLVDPSFGALLAASSPRIQGEFLRMWGKGMKGAIKAAPYVKPAAIQGAISTEQQPTQP